MPMEPNPGCRAPALRLPVQCEKIRAREPDLCGYVGSRWIKSCSSYRSLCRTPQRDVHGGS